MPSTKLLIYGQVQGVGFRYWARGKFKELGIVGTVWNNADGTVGVALHSPGKIIKEKLGLPGIRRTGIDKQIEKLINCLRQGPALARVKKVVIL